MFGILNWYNYHLFSIIWATQLVIVDGKYEKPLSLVDLRNFCFRQRFDFHSVHSHSCHPTMASKSQGEFLDPRFAELLKPIKDLTQNWEVNRTVGGWLVCYQN